MSESALGLVVSRPNFVQGLELEKYIFTVMHGKYKLNAFIKVWAAIGPIRQFTIILYQPTVGLQVSTYNLNRPILYVTIVIDL